MPDEGFLKRWSRLKATGGEMAEAPATKAPAPAVHPATAPAPQPAAAARAAASLADPPPAGAQQATMPTLADAARLTPDADFSSFVARDVDKAVQRMALKKLFADPHFHVMDGLDMYMDDYNIPSPVSAAMLASLDHARSALRYPDPPQPAAITGEEALPAALPEAAGADLDADGAGAAAADEVADAPADSLLQHRVTAEADNPSSHPIHATLPLAASTPSATPQQSLQGPA